MANRRTHQKLPSGSVRIQVYDFTDSLGKKHYRSFTAPTRQEAEFMAAQFKLHKNDHTEKLTVSEAVDRYIDLKRAVLSPSTVREYEGTKRRYVIGSWIAGMDVSGIRNRDLQKYVSELAEERSPKTVRNVYALVSASIQMFVPEKRLKVTLPQKIQPELYCPTDNDVRKILLRIRGEDLEVAVLLAAFGPLRRSEICALTDKDLNGNILTVSKALVLDESRNWVEKPPKTYHSTRQIWMPDFVVDRISWKTGKLCSLTPDQITKQFAYACKTAGVPHFRFHDLRHFAASVMHAMQIPDQYIQQRGGWVGENWKRIYRNTISTEMDKNDRIIAKRFEKIAE